MAVWPWRMPGITDLPENVLDIREDGRIVDGSRHFVLLGVGDLLQDAAQDFSRSGLGQSLDDGCGLEGRNRTDPLADHLHNFPDNLTGLAAHAGLHDEESQRYLTLQLVGDSGYRAL